MASFLCFNYGFSSISCSKILHKEKTPGVWLVRRARLITIGAVIIVPLEMCRILWHRDTYHLTNFVCSAAQFSDVCHHLLEGNESFVRIPQKAKRLRYFLKETLRVKFSRWHQICKKISLCQGFLTHHHLLLPDFFNLPLCSPDSTQKVWSNAEIRQRCIWARASN